MKNPKRWVCPLADQVCTTNTSYGMNVYMRLHFLQWTLFIALFLHLACTAASPAEPVQLQDTLSALPQETVVLAPDGKHIIAWGIVDLPKNTRLQIAYTMADAAARSELAAFLRVQVMERMDDFESATQTRITLYSREETKARIAGGVLKHYHMLRGDRLWALSRLNIYKDDIIAGFPPADRPWVRVVVGHLEGTPVRP